MKYKASDLNNFFDAAIFLVPDLGNPTSVVLQLLLLLVQVVPANLSCCQHWIFAEIVNSLFP